MSLPSNDLLPEQAAVLATPGADALGPILAKRFRAYGADVKRSILQLATTATAFVTLLAVMGVASHDNYWLTLLLALPAAGLLVRLFIIQHDCGHGSFFRHHRANDCVGLSSAYSP